MTRQNRDLWFVGIMFSIALVGYVVALVMIVTGYVPMSGFGHSPAHAARFCLDAGISCACLISVAIFGLTR